MYSSKFIVFKRTLWHFEFRGPRNSKAYETKVPWKSPSSMGSLIWPFVVKVLMLPHTKSSRPKPGFFFEHHFDTLDYFGVPVHWVFLRIWRVFWKIWAVFSGFWVFSDLLLLKRSGSLSFLKIFGWVFSKTWVFSGWVFFKMFKKKPGLQL